MPSKFSKEKKTGTPKSASPESTQEKKASSKSKKILADEQGDDIFEAEAPASPKATKATKSAKQPEDDDVDDDVDDVIEGGNGADEWNSVGEEENWDDPDFAEFDMPKSKTKKGGSKKKGDDDDDFKFDEDFKEFGLFNDDFSRDDDDY